MAKAAPGFRHRSVGEIGGQAADLPQEVLARLGGRPARRCARRIIAPGKTPIRTLVHAIGGDVERSGNGHAASRTALIQPI